MRERLAIARSVRPHLDICAASANGSRLGNLLLRGIDNGDIKALLDAKIILIIEAGKRVRSTLPAPQINKAAHHVIRYLVDQRCVPCAGRRYIINMTGVYAACILCGATGFVMGKPRHWGCVHDIILREALGAVGGALRHTRDMIGV